MRSTHKGKHTKRAKQVSTQAREHIKHTSTQACMHVGTQTRKDAKHAIT